MRVIHARAAALLLLLASSQVISGCDDEPTETGREGEYENYAVEQRQYYLQVASCMTDLGVPMRLMATGDGIEPLKTDGSVSKAEEDASLAAYSECSEKVGGHPEILLPNADEIGELYELNLDAVDCLKDNGLLAAEPPSKEVYVQSYLASLRGGEAPWSPYVEITPETFELCPEPTIADLYSD